MTGTHKGDKTFRKYAAIIERALSSWEISPEEWADYIAFLARLLKAVQSHPQDVAILPHSTSVASKLSQCMNPALPSGVHQKALELYAYIFSTFGRDFVSFHLDEFFPGLSAVLSFASLSVRPALYDIVEQHILPLSSLSLKPLLKALVLSLLPALEEETSEDFERAFRILETLETKYTHGSEGASGGDKNGFFWQCLFLAIITSPSRRQGALNFLIHKLPKFERNVEDAQAGASNDVNRSANALSVDAEAAISPEPGLLARAFVCGLSDPQLLVQRGFLDLLVTNLPLSSPLLQNRVRKDDLDRLITAAMHVLLRREMSLNRRLWSWFLGPEPKGEESESQPISPNVTGGESSGRSTNVQLEYFNAYGRPGLERSVLAMFKRAYPTATDRARPFRLCLSLMDRWEIGGSIVPEMFLPAISSAYEFSISAPAGDGADLTRSASLFFDSIEASLIWTNIISVLDSAFKQRATDTKSLSLCKWIIQHFNVKDEEMVILHIPRCVLLILGHLETATDLASAQTSLSLELVSTLLEAVPERALPIAMSAAPGGGILPSGSDIEALEDTIRSMYRSQHFSESDVAATTSEKITIALYHRCTTFTLRALRQGSDIEFCQAVALLSSLQAKAPSLDLLRLTDFLSKIMTILNERTSGSKMPEFPTIASTVGLVSAFKATSLTASLITEADVANLESIITPQVWTFLSPSRAKYHVEATKALWQLHDLAASGYHLEATLTALVRPSRSKSAQHDQDSAEAARRFGVLWTHSISSQSANAKQGPPGSLRRASTIPGIDVKQSIVRQEVLTEPLMLVLDMLSDPQTSSHAVVRSWLHSLSTLEQVFRIHFELLDDLLRQSPNRDGPDGAVNHRHQTDTARALEYTMGHFLPILKYGNEWVLECLNGLHLQSGRPGDSVTGLFCLVEHCSRFVCDEYPASEALIQTAIDIIEIVLSGPETAALKSLELDTLLIDRLLKLLEHTRIDYQSALLKLITNALKLRSVSEASDTRTDRPRSRNSISSKRPSTAGFRPSPNASNVALTPAPPGRLLLLLRTGFSSTAARPHLDKWLEFLSNVLPIFPDAIFTGLIPLVECLCKELDKAHAELVSASQTGPIPSANSPESAIMALLEALEMVLARAHRSLEEEEQAETDPRPTTQSRGLLGNVTSGVFKSEGLPSRTAHANSRLTVILAFQDAIKVSLWLWIWASQSTEIDDFDKNSSATTSYNALRVRNRTRHLLEQIFTVEPLESLEVVMSNWCVEKMASRAAASLNLLHVLQGTRPKNAIPAILDALCSRTNPSALPADRLSTQSTDLMASDVAAFLSAYLQSTEDDAMDEVWPDCMAFLRDVLANPLPYRQVLPALLLTVLLLAQKLENTNFGEQRKMRKELGDSFNRLLAAALTTMPSGYTQDPHASDEHLNRGDIATNGVARAQTSLIPALKDVTSNIEVILETTDRATSATNSISSSLIGPLFRARTFPENITSDTLGLLLQLSKKVPLAKAWKKELLDAFNDPRLLTSSIDMMEAHWFPVFHQWCLHDKERTPELLSRLTPPSSAGIMFGVGANAARLEADRKTQLNVRRICLLMLASPEDTFALHMRVFNEKLAELFEATASSSPSAAVKAELFMLCRAIVLTTSSVQLAPMWPIINDNLHAALASLLPNATNDTAFANLALLQACKLLDLLITLSPDEFQLHEWLYVTDTIDAVYQPADWDPAAMSDQIAVAMASDGIEEASSSLVAPTPIANAQSGLRRPLLDGQSMSSRDDFKAMARDDFAHTVLRPFLSQLSMYAYEAVYGMDTPDVDACRRSLVEDLLDLSTVVE